MESIALNPFEYIIALYNPFKYIITLYNPFNYIITLYNPIKYIITLYKGSSIKDVRKGEGVKGKGTRADIGGGGQARVDVHKKILKKVSKNFKSYI